MNKGSTFLELVVTVGVIAITSYIIVVSLKGTGESVKINNVQSSLGSLISTALACVDSGKIILDPVPGGHICESSVLLWPTLGANWEYIEYARSNPADATFFFGAKSEKDGKSIFCNQKGCVLN